jgi:hypothetical protein
MPTTEELWWEDRRGVLDRQRDVVWWVCLDWVVAAGLVAACLLWGWRSPLVAAATFAGLAALLLLPLRLFPGPLDPVRLLDEAVLTGLGLTGIGGILSLSLPLGLLVLTGLVATAPVVRREVRGMSTILRWSRQAAHDSRPHPAPGADDGPDWSWL